MPVRRPGGGRPDRRTADGAGAPHGLRRLSDYAWRLLVVAAAAYVVLMVLGKFHLITLAGFLALVITSVVRPLVDLFARGLPRPLAVLTGLAVAILVPAGLLALIGETVANDLSSLTKEFQGGLDRLEKALEGSPFHIAHQTFDDLQKKIADFLSAHRSTLISTAVSGASRAVEVATGAALALFMSVFFLHSGERMWRWTADLLPAAAGDHLDRGGRAAWRTFAGYTRGIFIVAASNAAMVGIALFLLRVPLALPLTVLEFFASFVPLVGSPIAMLVASLVALAARGPVIAIVVLLLIVVIGQIEGHLLHPLVMSWAVSLHPVVVAVSVLAGSIAAGVIGAVVAVPAVSVVWSVYAELRGPHATAPPPKAGP
ncbi:AI-2E family transporter [Kitasatospora sp. DSM 101779]|uniref:AI-2E family transporter n=1 Tax=Kitasatospora sp. DSM 101779 TaxID=2853165 RepID=UPI0021DAA930|nr:AI-2E family transporter [Kitasatospora sp. DSM 101779]MCU7820474.1 AI-2E family transporter [Kitasatospora sp. DSM 101779]